MTLTKKMMLEAIKTSHETCIGNDCIHAEIATQTRSIWRQEITEMVLKTMTSGGSYGEALERVYFDALHVGYRLHQLEMDFEIQKASNPTKIKKEK